MRNTILLLMLLAATNANAQSLFGDSTQLLHSPAIFKRTMDVQVMDLNGDGFKDIILAVEYDRNCLLFGNADGHYYDSTNGRLGNYLHDSEDIAIADLDKNGWPDIVFVSEDDSTHELYFNTGGGNFADSSHLLPHCVANAVVATDLNGDNAPDLIIGVAGQDRVLINDGTGHFTDETDARYPVSNDITQDLHLADVDEDGDMDLAVGNEDVNKLYINNGGYFTDETATRFPNINTVETRKISAEDVNGDGHIDLFFSNVAFLPLRDRQSRLFLNDGTGNFSDVTATHLPPVDTFHTLDAVFTDINGDSKPDIVLSRMPNTAPAVLLNTGDGHFSHVPGLLPGSVMGSQIAVYAHDFNSDGRTDLYFGSFGSSDRLLYRLEFPEGVKDLPRMAISIYPNPAHGVLRISHGFTKTVQVHASLSDISGRRLRDLDLSLSPGSDALADISGLVPGTYLLSLDGAEGRYAQLLVVE